jgi:hypothetical protein
MSGLKGALGVQWLQGSLRVDAARNQGKRLSAPINGSHLLRHIPGRLFFIGWCNLYLFVTLSLLVASFLNGLSDSLLGIDLFAFRWLSLLRWLLLES